jgi:hypothetical protein
MNRAQRGQHAKAPLELIEEAVHLLRTAPAGVLAAYYAGALPFVLGLLYFWGEMSRSALAEQHLAEAALGLAVLFLWMKFCQALFVGRIRTMISGTVPRATFRLYFRRFIIQSTIHATGLFLLPLALLIVLPFPWLFAFYQNAGTMPADEPAGLLATIRRAMRQAALWPRQNHFVLAVLAGFALFVFQNAAMVCFLLPGLIKMLLGVESVFTRSGLSLLNTTFFAAMAGLTYLCVDPIVKVVYALRCFYGESLESGDDLKAELKRASVALSAVISGAVLSCAFITCAHSHLQLAALDEGGLRDALTEQNLLLIFRGPPPFERRSAPYIFQFSAAESQTTMPELAPIPSKQPHVPETGVGAEDLDRTIRDVLQQPKYTWRMPRERPKETQAGDRGVIERFFDRAGELIQGWLKKIAERLGSWLRKLSMRSRPIPAGGGSGYGWVVMVHLLVYVLIVAVALGLVWLIYRLWRDWRRPAATMAAQPPQRLPDLSDENVGPEQLPEDGWTTLARELLARGELRLALRAFYLASLASLAARNLISLARFKSNRDYERELRRRGHALPEMLALFGEAVAVFDRSWYGRHQVDDQLVSDFAAKVEQMRGVAFS